jgi:ABC-2 type transport system permease protein
MTTTTDPVVTEALSAPRPPALDHVDASHHSSLRNWWSDTLVFAGRNIEHIRQIPEKLLDVTIQPLMFVLLFAYVFGGAIAVQGSNYREYLIGGILIQTLAFALVGPATAIATDLSEGVIDRFRSLPAKRSAYLAGHYLAEMAGMALSIVVLLTAGFMVGWRLHADMFHVTGAFLLLFMFCSAMIWVGTWVGLTVRAADAVMGVGFVVVFPLTFVSNAFVPINSLPTVLQWFAAWNPVSVVVQATRQMFGNPTLPITTHTWPLDHAQIAAFLYCALILVIAIPASLRRYRARTSD